MWKTILKRVLVMIPQLFLLSVIVFFLSKLMPGDPLSGLVGNGVSAERIAELRIKMGLDLPWYEQYIRWVTNAFQGDFGLSFSSKTPVGDLIASRLSNTIWLAALTTVLTYAIALPLGVLAGRYQNTWIDKLIIFYNYITYSIPTFVLGLLGLWLFGYTLGWFPTRGSVSSGAELEGLAYIFDRFRHILLPALLVAFTSTVGTIQYLRTGIVDAKTQDYVRTARAKGVPEKRVYTRHIFRNSILPIAAFFGYELTGIIFGSIFLERIFAIPGTGQLFINSVTERDYNVMIALILIYGIATLLGTLLSDIIMTIVDPRIRIK